MKDSLNLRTGLHFKCSFIGRKMIQREKMIFRGTDHLPQYWKRYFSMSEIGKEYEILYDDEDKDGNGNTLMMSDTEYEYYTNQRFFNLIKEGDHILSVGYGIGLIIPEVKKRKGILTVLEKHQRVLDLDPDLAPDVEIILGDVNEIDLSKVFGNRKFDIVFLDISEPSLHLENKISVLVKDGGTFHLWTHSVLPN